MNSLSLNNVSRIIKEHHIINDVSLTFGPGVTIITGSSGAGKSTLLNLIGLLDKPDKGTITYNDKTIDLDDVNAIDKYRAENVSFVFQDGNLLKGITVKHNLEIISELNGSLKEYEEITERFGISHILEQQAETISGGERQRASIVRALLKNAEFILADEPTGNLDEKNSIIVFNALSECAKKYNRSVIIVTHDIELAQKYADRIITIKDGKVSNDQVINNISTNDTDNNLKISKSKINIKEKIMIAKKVFASEKKKMGILILVISITLASLGLCSGLFFGGVDLVNAVNNSYLDTDLVEAVKKGDNVTRYLSNNPFNDEDFNYLEKSGLFSEIVGFCPITFKASYDMNMCELRNLRFIKLNKFFEDRLMKNDIKGKFPQNDNEIIIGTKEAITLFGTNDCIGKTIHLNSGSKEEFDVTVCGVNNTLNVDGNSYSYISNNVSYHFEEMFDKNRATIEIKTRIDECNSTVSGLGIPAIVNQYQEQKILIGNEPKEKNDIVADLSFINELLYNEISEPITSSNISSHMEEISNLLNTELYFFSNDVYTVKICGITENLEGVFITDEFFFEVEKPLPVQLNLYLKDKKAIDEFENNSINSKYSCIMKYKHIAVSIGNKTNSLIGVLSIVSLIMLIITIVVINSFVIISVEENKYQIGLLRALGGSKKSIGQIYSIKYSCIGIASSIIAIILFFIIKCAANRMLANKLITIDNVLLTIIMILIGGIVLTLFASFCSVRKIYKLRLADCLRAR